MQIQKKWVACLVLGLAGLSVSALAATPPQAAAAKPAFAKVAAAKPAPAAALALQKILPAQSSIRFTSTQMGVPVQGRFTQLSGTVHFDAKNLAATRIALDVPVASATLDSDDADAELPKAEWFDAARFPQANFVLTSAQAVGAGEYAVQGSLRIKGQSLPIKSRVRMVQSQGLTWASGSFRISRLAYKIGAGPWGDTSIVADPVDVQYKIALAGLAPF